MVKDDWGDLMKETYRMIHDRWGGHMHCQKQLAQSQCETQERCFADWHRLLMLMLLQERWICDKSHVHRQGRINTLGAASEMRRQRSRYKHWQMKALHMLNIQVNTYKWGQGKQGIRTRAGKYYRGRKINQGSGNRSRDRDRVDGSDTGTGGKGELDWIGNR